MFELFGTPLLLTTVFLLAYLIIKLYNFERSLPDFQQVFDDFGEGMGSTISGLVKDPMVKRSMTVLGKKSGEVRASAALKNKVAEKALSSNVLLKKALEYLDITPIEGLELMGDPTVGPIIRNLMAGFGKKAQSSGGSSSW